MLDVPMQKQRQLANKVDENCILQDPGYKLVLIFMKPILLEYEDNLKKECLCQTKMNLCQQKHAYNIKHAESMENSMQ